jgi:hypothetical protein
MCVKRNQTVRIGIINFIFLILGAQSVVCCYGNIIEAKSVVINIQTSSIFFQYVCDFFHSLIIINLNREIKCCILHSAQIFTTME